MKIYILSLTTCVAVFAYVSLFVSAYSDGTGSCAAGIGAIEDPSSMNTHILRSRETGTLETYGVTLTVNGNILTPDLPTPFVVDTDLVWSLDASKSPMKGVFVRVEGTMEDFTHLGDISTGVNTVPLCEAIPRVIGVDHSDKMNKTKISGTTFFGSVGSATMDITVVFDNIFLSVYAFSSFKFAIVAKQETKSPTLAATKAPSRRPTKAPIVAPTEVPTTRPTKAPIVAPSKRPTTAPTKAPVLSSTKEPTATPTKVPIVAPLSPTTVPTKVPLIAAPIDIPISPNTSPITPKPSLAPFAESTMAPMVSPITTPPITAAPTNVPITVPIFSPITAPTKSPLTAAPTKSPLTAAPTKLPLTAAPTNLPIAAPTSLPTSNPALASLPSRTNIPTSLQTEPSASTDVPIAVPITPRTTLPTTSPVTASPTKGPIILVVPTTPIKVPLPSPAVKTITMKERMMSMKKRMGMMK